MVRRSASPNLDRIEHIKERITLIPGDVTDLSCLCRIMENVQPDEVYNLAAQSFVKVSFEEPIHTCNTTGMGFLNVLEAVRLVNPWGFAGDYVEAMYQMLQHDKPDDFVVCTGETHTVREFCEAAFGHVGLDYSNYVEVNPAFYRPAEVDLLVGDCSKITSALGWKPKVTFKSLVKMMMEDVLK